MRDLYQSMLTTKLNEKVKKTKDDIYYQHSQFNKKIRENTKLSIDDYIKQVFRYEKDFQQSVHKFIVNHPFIVNNNIIACHIPNERKTTPRGGYYLNLLGRREGMPDEMIYAQSHDKKYVGLFFELKIHPRKLTSSQQEVGNALVAQGWYGIYPEYTMNHFIDQFNLYFNLK